MAGKRSLIPMLEGHSHDGSKGPRDKVRGCRPGKSVQMSEAEVRALCLKSREIFLQQPILLELEAPLKICGWGENDRGVSFTFGADVVSKFLNRHDLDLICRAHQILKPSEKKNKYQYGGMNSGRPSTPQRNPTKKK
uniref:protein-serine/threonine phosphatase n=1 Tax=Timema poppense TaxID=170557 RepID=A0A7R9DGE4_TIMPO|nr:unnamed protein product [Timema poppensis]